MKAGLRPTPIPRTKEEQFPQDLADTAPIVLSKTHCGIRRRKIAREPNQLLSALLARPSPDIE